MAVGHGEELSKPPGPWAQLAWSRGMSPDASGLPPGETETTPWLEEPQSS